QHIASGAAFLLQPDDGCEGDVWERHTGDGCTAVKCVLETRQRLTSAAQEPIGYVVRNREGADAGASEGGIERQRHKLLFDLAVGTTHQKNATGAVVASQHRLV